MIPMSQFAGCSWHWSFLSLHNLIDIVSQPNDVGMIGSSPRNSGHKPIGPLEVCVIDVLVVLSASLLSRDNVDIVWHFGFIIVCNLKVVYFERKERKKQPWTNKRNVVWELNYEKILLDAGLFRYSYEWPYRHA